MRICPMQSYQDMVASKCSQEGCAELVLRAIQRQAQRKAVWPEQGETRSGTDSRETKASPVPFFSKPGCQYLMTRLVWGVTIAKHGLFKKNFTARAGFIV